MNIHIWSLLKVIAVVERNKLENELANKVTRIVDSHNILPISKKQFLMGDKAVKEAIILSALNCILAHKAIRSL
jgi:hypothetical protein